MLFFELFYDYLFYNKNTFKKLTLFSKNVNCFKKLNYFFF